MIFKRHRRALAKKGDYIEMSRARGPMTCSRQIGPADPDEYYEAPAFTPLLTLLQIKGAQGSGL